MGPNPNTYFVKTATIAAAGTTSGAVDLLGFSLAAIVIPAAIDATSLSFLAAPPVNDGNGVYTPGTYVAVVDDAGNSVTVKVTAATATYSPVSTFIGARFIKIVSNDASEAVAVDLILILRPL